MNDRTLDRCFLWVRYLTLKHTKPSERRKEEEQQLKRIISVLLAACMIISLAACTKESGAPVSGSDALTVQYMPDIFSALRPVEDFAAVGVNVVDNGNFDLSDFVWSLYEESGGDASPVIEDLDSNPSIENNVMAVNIANGGSVAHGVQVYYDGIRLHQYAKYILSFDAWCTMPGKKMEARLQYNGGDYHAYAVIQPQLTEEPQNFSIDFTMTDDTDMAPRLAFNLGPAEDGSEVDLDCTNYTIYIDNVSVVCTDNSRVDFEAADVSRDININQLGYAPNSTKTAVFCGEAIVESFDVLDENGNVVYTGEITGPVKNYNALEYNWYGDFSALTEPGTYTIKADVFGESYPFEIGENIYENAFNDVVRMLYLQRCGCEIPESLGGDFAHAECHNTPARVYGTEDKFLEVSGGWHDAGDYGRYVVAGAKAVADILLAYDAAPDVFGDNSNIPESGNGVPDILDEARYEIEWMLKMQDPESGGVYHKVTCADFPGTVMPEHETAELILSPISRTATYDFIAIMCMANKYYAEFDADFAKTCLDAAMRAWEFAETSDYIPAFKNPSGIKTGEYPDGSYSDELFWAACELLDITGDKETYQPVIEDRMKLSIATGLGWADVGAYGIRTYLALDESKSDAAIRAQLLESLTGSANQALSKAVADGYHTALGGSNYVWGSNMSVANNAMVMLMVNDVAPNEKYEFYAMEQINYIFGVNPVSYCYVTGYGTISPTGTHHRPSQALEITMPGMLVGGPNANLEDPFALSMLSTEAPARCYIDNTAAYSLNEITIYWNSPLIYIMARLCDLA